MFKKIIVALAFLIILTNTHGFASSMGIESSVKAYLLSDFNTGDILNEYNIDKTLEIASLTKLMSYIITIDAINNGEISFEDIVVIDLETSKIGGSSFKVKANEKYTVRELLEASLIVSGNDATFAIAKHISKKESEFVKRMNEKAKLIGLETAVFYNSTGLPMGNKQNKMSTRDLLKLTEYILNNYPDILNITNKKTISDESRGYFGRNTNSVLYSMSNVDGLKTGFTDKAGYCQIITFTKPGEQHQSNPMRFISIIMGTDSFQNRGLLSKILVDYGLNTYTDKILVSNQVPVRTLDLKNTSVEVYAKEQFEKRVHRFSEINTIVEIDENINFPINKNQTIGEISVIEDNETIFKTELIVKENISEIKIEEEIIAKEDLFHLIKKYLNKVFSIFK